MADPVNILELFAGHGMLGEGVKLASPGARVCGYVEREAYAAACLMARMEDKALEPAPVFCGDIQDVDGREFRHVPGLWIVGGFPCQDISLAGKGGGVAHGARSGLWREYARIIEESGAAGVFAENVSALVGRGLDIVLADLAQMGFSAEWGCFTAQAVGAPHRRERIFIMAHRAQRGQRKRGQSSERYGQPHGRVQELADAPSSERRGPDSRERTQRRTAAGGTSEVLDDAAGPRRDEARQRASADEQGRERMPGKGRGQLADPTNDNRGGRISGEEEGTGPRKGGRRRPSGQGHEVGDAGGEGREGRERAGASGEGSRASQPACEPGCHELPPFPPGPGDQQAWAAIIAHPATAFLRPAVEPGVRVLADGLALVVDQSRADQLRGTGNGVVALQAALAFDVLAERLGIDV